MGLAVYRENCSHQIQPQSLSSLPLLTFEAERPSRKASVFFPRGYVFIQESYRILKKGQPLSGTQTAFQM